MGIVTRTGGTIAFFGTSGRNDATGRTVADIEQLPWGSPFLSPNPPSPTCDKSVPALNFFPGQELTV